MTHSSKKGATPGKIYTVSQLLARAGKSSFNYVGRQGRGTISVKRFKR